MAVLSTAPGQGQQDAGAEQDGDGPGAHDLNAVFHSSHTPSCGFRVCW